MALWKKAPKVFFSPGYNSPIGWPKPFVFTLHDLHHLYVREKWNAAKQVYYQHIIRPACRRAAFVLTVSEYSKREIASWAKVDDRKIVNVGNGVGFPFVPMGPRHDPGYPYLLYVGSRKSHKNLSRLLAAYAASGVRKDIRLVLSGHPDLELSREIARLGLHGAVAFIDLAADRDLSDVYRGALGFVFPSLYEGFGLPPVEAMACGVPVLSSNVCSLPEVLGDAAVFVDPHRSEAIAEGIKRLVYDSTLREQLRERGFRRATKFSWEETARRSSEVLRIAAGGA